VPSFAKKRLPTSGARNQVEEALDETFVTVCETVVTVKHFDHGPVAAESSLSKPSFEWSDCLDTHEFPRRQQKSEGPGTYVKATSSLRRRYATAPI
jgi:hypothetical protein